MDPRTKLLNSMQVKLNQPLTFFIFIPVQVLVQEQQGDQLHPMAGEPAAVLVDDQAS